jgi:hypothetical protein
MCLFLRFLKTNTMGLQCGIVGLPNVGKSTLFNALSDAKAQAANFPFCTIEPNVGVISVPDERLNTIASLVNPERVVPTSVEIVDIAGLVKGASKGEGLGNQFLSNIRNTNAIIHVLRCFDDPNIIHVDGSVNPLRDKEIIDTELQLKDLETIEKVINKVQRAARSGDKEAQKILDLAQSMKAHLEKGLNARTFKAENEDMPIVSNFNLLTAKPVLYVLNVDDSSVIGGNQLVEQVRPVIEAEGSQYLMISAAIEAEIAQLESYEDRQAFLNDMGLKESGVSRLVQHAYRLLNLITFFTAGPKEVRAWTIHKGDTALEAAGVIHSDFAKGFIRAEVISYHDFITHGSEKACRENGKLRLEGKEYVVQDGDIMHFLFNV